MSACHARRWMLYFTRWLASEHMCLSRMRTSILPRPAWLLPIAAVSILVLWMTTPGPAATRLVSHWRPQPMLTEPDQPAQHPNPPQPALSGAALPVAQFDISVADGLYADQRQPLADDLQR